MADMAYDGGRNGARTELELYTQPVRKMDRPLVGRENEILKLKAALCRPEYSNVILLAPAGSGKAQPDDTPIPVADPRGYVPIGKLKPGDMVFDEAGNPVRVLGVFPQGIKRRYDVYFEDGTMSSCNDEHLWAVRTRDDPVYRVHTLRGLMDLGLMEADATEAWPRFRVPAAAAVRRPDSADPELRYGVSAAAVSATNAAIDGAGAVIDSRYFLGSEAQRRVYLDGVILALSRRRLDLDAFSLHDGRLDNACVGDRAFAESLRDLYASLGERFEVYTRKDKWGIRRALTGASPQDGVAITGVVDTGMDVQMTCIYVDCPSHLYQSGKEHIVTHNTALIQGLMEADPDRRYLEVDLAKMIANLNDKNEMAARLKGLFDGVEEHGRRTGQEIVLFVDEFHQVVQLSEAAVEALKPLLASSGNRGIKVIAATTLLEFNQYIAPNQPLVERLQRINLSEPGRDAVMEILRGFAKKYGVENEIPDDALYELIYEYTNRYIPANAQPRKSILLLDAMVGYHRAANLPFGRKLLSEVLYQSEGINVSFKVDATKIKEKLDAAVYAQEWATRTVSDAIQVAVADLNDKSKPMCSMLFCGSTGTGKQIDDDEPVPVYTEDGSVHVKRNGDLVVGDLVFNRAGKPVVVTGVFPQGVQDVYEVELTDGRILRVGDGHLWTYRSRFGNGAKKWKVADTKTLMEKYQRKYYNPGRTAHNIKFVIPMNQAVEWPEARYDLDPYVVGAFIGNGCLTESTLSFSSNDEETVQKIAGLIGADGYHKCSGSFTWYFSVPETKPLFRKGTVGKSNLRLKWFTTKYVFASVSELVGLRSPERFIPEAYKHGSVEQRWALVRGLFDTDGHIGSAPSNGMHGRYNLHYNSASERLVKDLQEVLWSLGISSRISDYGIREGRPESRSHEYSLHVMVGNADKEKFFSLSRKLAIARLAKASDAGKTRVKKFGEIIGIRDIRKLDERVPMTCIMVDDPEHLYQAGDFVVTHNTEVCKALAGALFGDGRNDGDTNQNANRNLIRVDCSEFSQPSSVERFRKELTARIWERPFSIVLLDEIEKACGEVIRLLLQVLDDGRLTDAHERQVVFTNAYIVLTTNASSNVFKDLGPYIESDTGAGEQLKEMMSAFRTAITTTQTGNKFPPELLGRIDAIIPFQPLSRETIRKIVFRELRKLSREVLTKHGVELRVDQKVLDYIVEDSVETDTDAGGARQAIGKLRSEVTIPVAAWINGHPETTRLRVSVEGKGAWEDKKVLHSEARVVVNEI